MTTTKPSILTSQSLIPAGLAGSLLVSMLTGYIYLESRFRAVEKLLESLDRRMERVELRQEESLSKAEMSIWLAKLARDNPSLQIPSLGG